MNNKKRAISAIQSIIMLVIVAVILINSTPSLTRKISEAMNNSFAAKAKGWYEAYYALPEGAQYYLPNCKSTLNPENEADKKEIEKLIKEDITKCEVKTVTSNEAGHPELNLFALDVTKLKPFERVCSSAMDCTKPVACSDAGCKFNPEKHAPNVASGSQFVIYAVGAGGSSGSAVNATNPKAEALGKVQTTPLGTTSLANDDTNDIPKGSYLDFAKINTAGGLGTKKFSISGGNTVETMVSQRNNANNLDNKRENLLGGSATNVFYVTEDVTGTHASNVIDTVYPTKDYTGFDNNRTKLQTPFADSNKVAYSSSDERRTTPLEQFVNRYYVYTKQLGFDCNKSVVKKLNEWLAVYSDDSPVKDPTIDDPDFCKNNPDIFFCYCKSHPTEAKCKCENRPDDLDCICKANPNDSRCKPIASDPSTQYLTVKACSGDGAQGADFKIKNNWEFCKEIRSCDGGTAGGTCCQHSKYNTTSTCVAQNEAGNCTKWKATSRSEKRCGYAPNGGSAYETISCKPEYASITKEKENSVKNIATTLAAFKMYQDLYKMCLIEAQFNNANDAFAAAGVPNGEFPAGDPGNMFGEDPSGAPYTEAQTVGPSGEIPGTVYKRAEYPGKFLARVNCGRPEGCTRNEEMYESELARGGKGQKGVCVSRYKKIVKNQIHSFHNGANKGLGKNGATPNPSSDTLTTAASEHKCYVTDRTAAQVLNAAGNDVVDKNSYRHYNFPHALADGSQTANGYGKAGQNGSDSVACIEGKCCKTIGGKGGFGGFLEDCTICKRDQNRNLGISTPGESPANVNQYCGAKSGDQGWRISCKNGECPDGVSASSGVIDEYVVDGYRPTDPANPGLYNYRFVWYMPYVTKHLMFGEHGSNGDETIRKTTLSATDEVVITLGKPGAVTQYKSGADGANGGNTTVVYKDKYNKTSQIVRNGGKGGRGSLSTYEYLLCHIADKRNPISPCYKEKDDNSTKTTEELTDVAQKDNVFTSTNYVMSHSLRVSNPGGGSKGYSTKSLNDYVCEERYAEKWDRVTYIGGTYEEVNGGHLLSSKGTADKCKDNARIKYIRPDGVEYVPGTGAVIIAW